MTLDLAITPIILYNDKGDPATLYGEPCALLANEGWLVKCELDTLEVIDPPCGFHHRGSGIYHLAPGKDIDDLPTL